MNILNGTVVRLLIHVRGSKPTVLGIRPIHTNTNMADMTLFFWIKMCHKSHLNFYRMPLKMLKAFLCKDGLITGTHDAMH